MKYLFVITQIVLLSAFSLSQTQSGKSQELNRSVAAFYQSGKYDEAIPMAEDIVGLERKGTSPKNLVNALENLAQIRVARFKRSAAALNSGAVDAADVTNTVAKLRSDAESGEANLREAIRLADATPSNFTEQRITMRNSLAWLLYSYQPPDPEVSIAFDKIARDKFEMRARARFYKRRNEAANLYQEALKIGSESANPNDNATLLTTYNYAEFNLAMGDLENAIERFEKCIAGVERIYGKKSPSLVQPLESYIKALAATGQDDLAFETIGRLVRVTAKSAAMPKTLLNLSLRADKSFAPTNATGVENSARANKERVTLASRRATLDASLDVILSASTQGREYYDAGIPVYVIKVAVRVLVDETGKVIEAEALTADKERKSDAEAAVKEWRLKPFTAGGQPHRMKGYVECIILADRTAR
jgi:tetratricopeptide (TPR) repeat protein